MSKPIAIAFSDIHLHDWKAYNEKHYRLNYPLELLDRLIKLSNELEVPLLFCGDLIHDPKNMSNYVFNGLMSIFRAKSIMPPIYGISGNHDMCEKNSIRDISPSYIEGFQPFFKCMDNLTKNIGKDLYLHGIPYMNSEEQFIIALKQTAENLPKGINILMIHQNLPGAKEPDGFEVESDMPPQIYKLMQKFTWVLCGHIHKPQQIFENTFMLGATNHQDLGDMGCDMGYWMIYADKKPKFVKSNLPEFKTYSGEKPDSFNLWVEEGKEVEEEDEGSGEFKVLTSRRSLAENYCKEKGIKNKRKLKALVKALNAGD